MLRFTTSTPEANGTKVRENESHRRQEAPLTAIGAEKSLLGALIASPHTFWEIDLRIRADQFALALHREIFSVIRDLSYEGKAIAFQSVSNRLPDEYGDGESTPAYLSALIHNAVGLGANDFADQVAEVAGRRELDRIGKAMQKAALSIDGSAMDHAAEAESALLDMMQITAAKQARSIGDLAEAVHRQAVYTKQTDRMPGFNTGLDSLDEILGLIMPGDFGAIQASQGDGKTSLATQIGVQAAKLGRPALMFQLEMGAEQIAARELGRRAGVSVREINEGAFTFDGAHAIKTATAAMKDLPFYILDEARMTMKHIRNRAIAFKRRQGHLGLIIVDHLRLVRSDNSRSKDRFERQGEISGDMKSLAKELDCAVLALVQRTRTSQRRDDPTPHIDDADSPAIEQDADWIVGVWRKATWLLRNKPSHDGGEEWDKWQADLRKAKNIADMIVLKRRRGPAGEQRQFGWIGETTSFCELADIAKQLERKSVF